MKSFHGLTSQLHYGINHHVSFNLQHFKLSSRNSSRIWIWRRDGVEIEIEISNLDDEQKKKKKEIMANGAGGWVILPLKKIQRINKLTLFLSCYGQNPPAPRAPSPSSPLSLVSPIPKQPHTQSHTHHTLAQGRSSWVSDRSKKPTRRTAMTPHSHSFFRLKIPSFHSSSTISFLFSLSPLESHSTQPHVNSFLTYDSLIQI